MIKLRELSVNDGTEVESTDIYEMIMEIGRGQNGFVNSLYADQFSGFQQLIERNAHLSKGNDLPSGFVPQTIYWLYDGGRPVGYGKLRHYLNDRLLDVGGHIGYIIRPSERSKGYATILLSELLKKSKELSIPEVLLTCNEDNLPSRKVIESNGGQLTETSDGHCKYWIALK